MRMLCFCSVCDTKTILTQKIPTSSTEVWVSNDFLCITTIVLPCSTRAAWRGPRPWALCPGWRGRWGCSPASRSTWTPSLSPGSDAPPEKKRIGHKTMSVCFIQKIFGTFDGCVHSVHTQHIVSSMNSLASNTGITLELNRYFVTPSVCNSAVPDWLHCLYFALSLQENFDK